MTLSTDSGVYLCRAQLFASVPLSRRITFETAERAPEDLERWLDGPIRFLVADRPAGRGVVATYEKHGRLCRASS